MPRLFVAVPLPAATRHELAALVEGVPGARRTRPEQLHLTLRFLGEVDDATEGRVVVALRGIRAGGFSLTPEGVGCFPRPAGARILWAGLRDCPALVALQAAVERAVIAAGLEPERRPFHPHVTLARLRGTPRRVVAAWLERHEGFRSEPVPVAELVLFASELHPRGAVHAPVERLALGPSDVTRQERDG